MNSKTEAVEEEGLWLAVIREYGLFLIRFGMKLKEKRNK